MYRTTKKKVVKRASLSIVFCLGALVTGVGVANASAPVHHGAVVISQSAQGTPRSPTTAKESRVVANLAVGPQSAVLADSPSRRELGS
jgi:hypothetical protein